MNENKNIIVLAQSYKEAKRLALIGKNYSSHFNCNLKILTAVAPSLINESMAMQFDDIYNLAKQTGGDSTIIFSSDTVKAIADFISENDPIMIISGLPSFEKVSIIDYIKSEFPHTLLAMVDKNSTIYKVYPRLALA